ncbi:receptor binding protein [Staphylococcus phage Twort]|uniref:Receptor binding protein n=1 Tax=Staphylococcus phage Twort (strain DSM 17442 / HER 48) TaxID=2908167 RepID=A0A6H0X5B5_BPTWO|nr:receptor binding protein [Staphylococcus phage Twort]
MAFTFKQLKGTDYLRDAYPKINELGINSASLSQEVDKIKEMFSDIQSFNITDNTGKTPEGSQINQDYLNNYIDVYGSLTYPPSNTASNGWVNARITNSGEGILIFLPDNSEKIFKKTKHSGQWSDWTSFSSDAELNKFIPGDINNNGDFDYKWDSGSGTLEEEISKVAPGLSLFYANQHMSNSKFTEPVRGTIQKDLVSNGYVAIVKAIGYSGKEYVIPVINGTAKPLQQTIMTTDLWKGSQDLATKSTLRLNDAVSNYDYLEFYVEFYAGGVNTFKAPSRLTTVYFRDFNLTNNDTNSGFDLFEGAVSIDSSGLTFTPYLSKKVTGSSIWFNQTGYITIKSITGIKHV